jgi:TolB protein
MMWGLRNLDRAEVRGVAAGLGLFLVLSFSPGQVHGQVRGTIAGPGHATFPIAIVPPQGGGFDRLGIEFAETLGRDLDLSGLFRVLPKPPTDRQPRDSGVQRQQIDFGAWEGLGARLLVKGAIGTQDGELVVAVRLFDVRERQQVGGKKYIGRLGDLTQMADRFADRILFLLTGEQGPFDSRIAFISTREGGFKELWVARADGSGARQVTRNRTINLSPGWAPDAERLLLTSYRDGRPRLYELSTRTLELRQVLGGPGFVVGGRYSPDGQQIAVAREEQRGNSEILLMSPQGDRLRLLTDDRGIDVSPTWSPDGKQVAFCSSRDGTPQIYVATLASGEVQRVTFAGSYNTSPSWSPAGGQLAFTGRVKGQFQIFVLALDSGAIRQITTAAGDSTGASWSPDGRYMVFASTRRGRGEIYLSDAQGLVQRRLIATSGDDSSPAWSPRLSAGSEK